MKTLSIRGRILGTFGIMLVVMSAIGVYAFSHLSEIEQRAITVKTEIVPALYRGQLIKDALNVQSTQVLTAFAQRDPVQKRRDQEEIERRWAEIGALIDDYERTATTDAGRQRFAEFKLAYSGYQAFSANLSRIDSVADLQKLIVQISTEYNPKFRSLMNAIDKLAEYNRSRAIETADRAQTSIHSFVLLTTLGFLCGLVVTLIGASLLYRSIMRPLTRLIELMAIMRGGDFTQRMKVDGKDEISELAEGFNSMADEVMGLVGQVQRSGVRVSTSMMEIAATSKQQQATASEVAATTTQIGATSREISATSRELVRTMHEVSTVAEHAAGLAGSGQSGLSHMEETMGHVMEAAASINGKLAVLNEKASNINQVVTTITKVADQTNLLSLNAAIEAEKAGEYGRGFAVVSSEIRRLADQTAIATYDIEQMVKEIQAAVSAGVMGMDKFSEEVRRGLHDVHEIGGKLSEIIAQVQALVPRFETVNEGMQAQATGAEQISEALLQLSESTQQTVESLRQSSDAIDELSQVSDNLHGSISRFKLASA